MKRVTTVRFWLVCALFACLSVYAPAQLLISEFMADNESVLQDEDGEYSDWIEIHNPSGAPIDLAGWHLTDETNNLSLWTFPATNIAANGFVVVFASAKDRSTSGQELHTSFKLDAGGEFLALVSPDGTNVVSSFKPEYPKQFNDVAYGYQTHGTNLTLRAGEPGYLIEHTPGTANTIWPAPHPVYADHSVARIDIYIRQQDWDALKYGTSEEKVVFRFRHEDVDVTLTNVAMRRRGNTSYDQLPRSFQVSFNTFVPGQDLFDMEKLNLNAEVNDPTMARSKLLNDVVLAAGLPGSYANHTALVVHFTNGNHAVWFDSLHNNTQPVDDVLMEQRYGTSAANLYKCLYNQWPADLTYRGPDGSSYIGDGTTYALKYPGGTDSTYNDLAYFIDLINNTSSNDFPNVIMSRFEVDAFLKRMAVDVLTGNWDDHWQLHNNYYLFDNPTRDRWTMIPYDFDNTFGIDWVGDDWGTKNVYNFGDNSQSVNPLISRIFSVPELRDRYSYYMSEMLGSFYTSAKLSARAYAIRDTLTAPLPFGSPTVSNMKDKDRDNYSYAWPQTSYNDFYYSYDSPQVYNIPDDYGLTPFFGTRISSALSQLEVTNIAPVISAFSFDPGLPRVGDPIRITADVFDDVAVTSVVFWYEFDGAGYTNVELMADSDGLYGTSLPAFSTNGTLTYYVAAADDTGATMYEPFGGPTYAFSVDIDSPSLSLVVTELNYHPHDPEGSEIGVSDDEDDYEFIELRNTGSSTLQLAGYELADAVSYVFPSYSLSPGGFVLVVRNENAFEARYGTTNPVVGEYGGKFSDSGEQVRLMDAQSREITVFTYSDSGAWPGRSDGSGSALEVVDTEGDYTDADNWRSSSEYGGTPGYVGLGPDNRIVVNEILTHTDPPLVDSIELYNTTESAIDIGGWFLSDDNGRLQKYRIQPGIVIAGLTYRVFNETNHFNTSMGVDSNDFAFSGAHGDDVWLMEADASSNLVRFVDHVDFGAAKNGESFGRWPNGLGTPYPMVSRTFSSSNSGPRVGPVVISEIMYNPPSGLSDHEYVEIYNPFLTATNISGWKLNNAVDFTFTNTIIPATSVVVVITFDPLIPANATRLSDFRSTYGIDTNVMLIGGFDGQLNNAGEKLQLLNPDEPPMEEPLFTPMLLEDQADYDELSPWPTAPDGHGPALTRLIPAQWGDAAASWFSGNPSPGSVNLSTSLLALTISSEHGTPAPIAGIHYITSGSLITNVVTPSETNGAYRYFNTGWSMTGNAPLIGFSQTCTMTLTNTAALTWKWTTNYLLAVDGSPGGSVSPSSSWKLPEAQVELSAAASNEFVFTGWSGDTAAITTGSANDATVTVTMTGPVSLHADFAQSYHTLTVVTPFGTPSPSTGTHVYAHGTVLTNWITGDMSSGGTQLVATGWTMTGNIPLSGSSTSLFMTITNSATLTWDWATNFWLTVTQNAEGVIGPTSGWFEAGSSVPLTASPPTNMFFWEWTGDVGLITSGDLNSEAVTVQLARAASLTAIYYILDTSSNLLRNSSFEVQGSAVSNAYYWETGHPDSLGNTWGSASRVDWRASDGSWEATVRGTWAGTGNQGGWWQSAPAEEGYYYLASGSFYESDPWTSSAQGLLLEFLSTNGAVISATNNPLNELDDSWTTKSVAAFAPAGSDRVRYSVYAYGSGADGALQFDSVSLFSYIWHEPYVTITATAVQNGSVSPSGSWKVLWGSDTNIVVEAAPYYHIDTVELNGSAVGTFGPGSNQYDHAIENARSNTALTASFAENLALNEVPEWWLADNGMTNLSWNLEAATDHDLDGLETWREYWAGTLPLDSNSVLEATSVSGIGANAIVRWSSESNKLYSLWMWPSLLDTQSLVEAHIPATPPVNTYTDTVNNAASRFYQVEVER